MSDTNQTEPQDGSNESVIKEEVRLQFHWYIFIFIVIYYGSWIFPILLFFLYVGLYFGPYFLDETNFFALFLNLNSLISLLTMPLIIIGCYVLHLFLNGVITRVFWSITEKISPTKSGVIPRNFTSKTLKFYHIRSFFLKYPKNTFMKGPFPWFTKYLYNFVGTSKIGKGTTIEESVVSAKHYEIGRNCYFGVNSSIASHLVEGIFGNINYFKIKIGDNVTAAGANQIGPGSEIHDNSHLLPLASCTKHSVLKGNNYYYGIPLRKIFKKKLFEILKFSPDQFNEDIVIKREKRIKIEDENEFKENEQKRDKALDEQNDYDKSELLIDFATSSAISRVNLKFLIVYIPILWFSGFLVTIYVHLITWAPSQIYIVLSLMPISLIIMIYLFILGNLIMCKLLLVLINLIHKPKEGVFRAEIGDMDYEFWMLRTELKKIVLWLVRNSPLPWLDVIAIKLFGVKIDFSSHLTDAWCDVEFIKFGRKVMVGQGALVMSSMVVGKYLIIKKVIFDDYALIGGHATIAPGTIIGKDSVIGAISTTTYNQILEPSWIYFGIPSIKLKPNKYAESRRDVIVKKDVDDEKKFKVIYEINVEESKKTKVNFKGDDL
ncbi:MAG: hypothetical protein ACFFBP_16930 [Promethearchaeota archaeon]